MLAADLPILVLACDLAKVRAYVPTAAKVTVPEMRHASQLALACGDVGSGSDEEAVALVKVDGMKAEPIGRL